MSVTREIQFIDGPLDGHCREVERLKPPVMIHVMSKTPAKTGYGHLEHLVNFYYRYAFTSEEFCEICNREVWIFSYVDWETVAGNNDEGEQFDA